MMHVLGLFLREWPFRTGSLFVPILGVAGATFILVCVFAIANGISDAMKRGGEEDTAIVIDRDAQIETSSRLSDDDVAAITGALGNEQSLVVSPELVQTVDTVSRGGEAGAQVLARALGASGIRLRKSFRIVAGRLFTPGKFEVIVGRRLARDFAGLELGTTLTGGAREWSIVGVFEAGGGTAESEVWMDLDSARMESGSRAHVSSLRVQPLSESRLGAFREAVQRIPRLRVHVAAEREHQSRLLSEAIGRIRLLAFGLALLLGVGAIVASINTMSATIVARARAVATLRALGFSPSATAVALFVETIILGVLGGAVGAGAAFLVADGYGVSILNGATHTPFALSATVTTASLWQGISLAAVLAAAAAIVPCVSLARMPIVPALNSPK